MDAIYLFSLRAKRATQTQPIIMPLLRLLDRFLGNGLTGESIRWSDEWKEIKSGTKWTFVEQTSYGVKLRKKFCKRMKHMETGEVQDIYRRDTEVEWHEHTDVWPDYVFEAVDNGEVWWADVKDPDDVPKMWPEIMTNGGSLWRKE